MLNDAPRRMPPEKIPPARRLFFDPFFKGDVKQQVYIDGSDGILRRQPKDLMVLYAENHRLLVVACNYTFPLTTSPNFYS